MIWHWPQIVYAGLFGLSVILHVSKRGEPRSAYDGPSTFIVCCICIWILYMGGFWTGGTP